MRKVSLLNWQELPSRTPMKAKVEGVDLLIIRQGEAVSVLYGRCLHRGVLLANGTLVGNKIICGWHGWGFHIDTGASAQACPDLKKFHAWIEDELLWVDADEIAAWNAANPQPFVASG